MFYLPCRLDNGILVLGITFVEHRFNIGWRVFSQLTKCRYGVQVFYVRENFNGVPSFLLSSQARMGIKSKAIPKRYQTLELCCPSLLFDELATLIHEFDHMRRPVRKNAKFTYGWAQRHMKGDP